MDKCVLLITQVYPDSCTSTIIYIMQTVLLKDKGELINSCSRNDYFFLMIGKIMLLIVQPQSYEKKGSKNQF